MHLDAHTLRDRQRALGMEWLLADGAGGYASSTVLLCGTRRYHGLWVPALKPPVDRRVILSHFDERLTTDAGEYFLSTTEYGEGFFPDGSPLAESFDLDPLPLLVSRPGRQPSSAKCYSSAAAPASASPTASNAKGIGRCASARCWPSGRCTTLNTSAAEFTYPRSAGDAGIPLPFREYAGHLPLGRRRGGRRRRRGLVLRRPKARRTPPRIRLRRGPPHAGVAHVVRHVGRRVPRVLLD